MIKHLYKMNTALYMLEIKYKWLFKNLPLMKDKSFVWVPAIVLEAPFSGVKTAL